MLAWIYTFDLRDFEWSFKSDQIDLLAQAITKPLSFSSLTYEFVYVKGPS